MTFSLDPRFYGPALCLASALPFTAAADTLSSSISQQWSTAHFTVALTPTQLQVHSRGKTLWASRPGQSFVRAASHQLSAHENRGSFIVEENIEATCATQTIEQVVQHQDTIQITGQLIGADSCAGPYALTFSEASPQRLKFEMAFTNPHINYSELHYASRAEERFYGFGEQFSRLNLKGERVPILSEEGGVGRGHTPISQAVDLGSPGSAGNALTTYYAVPQYITSDNHSVFLENTDYAVFDLTQPESVRIQLFNSIMAGQILYGNSPLDLITGFTEYAGRMRPLPDWFNQGAVVGMQGGTDKVTAVQEELQRRGTPVAGFWLQDWVGKRQTSFGSQLWWNWELDQERYPNWNTLVDRIESNGGHMLCYINPFLVDATEKGNVRRNLYQEATALGYLVTHQDGRAYEVTNTDFDAGMVDLTHPEARIWMKDIIKTQLIGEGRCHGWMHDFAEALPFDAKLHSGVSAAEYHNQYPVEWAKIAREAIEEAGLGNDIVFFNRSGAARTPAFSTLLWQGDQLVTWDKYDGFKTAILATLTGGFSGISLNHSDIGGYTNASFSGVGYDREQELLLRWMEFSAFTAAYRTHEGLKPEDNAQFYDNETTYRHFDRFARVYAALGFYRKTLFQEAASKGWPLVRHPLLHYPNDAELAELTDHFLLGSEILVAPIVNKNAYNKGWKKVYFPDGANTTWINAWTGKRYGKNGNTSAPWWLNWMNPAKGNWEWVYAPLGQPPVFYREGSAVGAQFSANLYAQGIR